MVACDGASVSAIGVSGSAFISFRERATWTAKDGIRRSQQSLATAEIRENLLTRLWYFPAVPDPK